MSEVVEEVSEGRADNLEEHEEFDAEKKRLENEIKRRVELRAALVIQLEKRLPASEARAKKSKKAVVGNGPKKTEKQKAELRARRTNDPNNPNTVHNYNMHRLRVQTVKPVVDTSSPIVARNLFSHPTSFNRRLASYTRIEKENAIMLRRIAGILQGGATIDNKLKYQGHPMNKNVHTRQVNLFRMTLENLALLKRIQNVKPQIDTKTLLNEYKETEKIIERLSIYPLHWKSKPLKGWETHVERAKSRGPVDYCYLRLGTDTETLGEIGIELNYAVTPMTCENFRGLCTGELGLSYKCSQIHRIIRDMLWQGGDVTGQEGFGNKSIYGDSFPDENFKLRHDEPGVMSMANCGPNSNGSQFIITARKAPALDGINVVFGKVVSGMNVLLRLYDYLGSTGVPKCDISILDCGVMKEPPQIRKSEDNNEGSSVQDSESIPEDLSTTATPESDNSTSEPDNTSSEHVA